MNPLVRQLLESNGGRCPFPDTDPDIWVSPDGSVGRIVCIPLDPREGEGEFRMEFLPLELH
jgi:hypothetical protein